VKSAIAVHPPESGIFGSTQFAIFSLDNLRLADLVSEFLFC
jgi:hypothetical protein